MQISDPVLEYTFGHSKAPGTSNLYRVPYYALSYSPWQRRMFGFAVS